MTTHYRIGFHSACRSAGPDDGFTSEPGACDCLACLQVALGQATRYDARVPDCITMTPMLARLVEFLEVRIEPIPREVRGGMPPVRELRIKCRVNGQNYQTANVLSPNDMLSMFDRLLDEARYQMHRMVKDEVRQPTLTDRSGLW